VEVHGVVFPLKILMSPNSKDNPSQLLLKNVKS
jgi:hypothetical protein